MTFDEQLACRTLWQECRGEPEAGRQAVAHVLINRLKSGRWGHSLAAVCHAHWQFSAWWAQDANDRLVLIESLELGDNDPTLLALFAILTKARTEPDPTQGATHYYAPAAVAEPAWVKGDPAHGIPAAIFAGKFGRQLFYRNVA